MLKNNFGLLSLVVTALPPVCYGLTAVALFSLKLPDRFLPLTGFVLSPVYLLLSLEEKFGGKKLAGILSERDIPIWSEVLMVTVMVMLVVWGINSFLLNNNCSLPVRFLWSCACIMGMCLASAGSIFLLR